MKCYKCEKIQAKYDELLSYVPKSPQPSERELIKENVRLKNEINRLQNLLDKARAMLAESVAREENYRK